MPSHEQYLQLCEAGARIFSRCSRRSYFAIVLSANGRTLGTGYNGAPAGLPNCIDGGCPRASAAVAHGSSYSNCTAVHAEGNALLHSDRSAREGGTLYVNGPPCWECSKLIAGSGITTVVHTSDLAYKDWPKCQALLESVGLNVICIDAGSNSPRNLGCEVFIRPSLQVDMAAGDRRRDSLADGIDSGSSVCHDSPVAGDGWPYG